MILHKEFIKISKQNPKQLAIIDESSKVKAEYSKLLVGSIIIAKYLKKNKDTNIGIMIPNSFGSSIFILGILMASKTPVMINYSTGAIKNSKYAREKCCFSTIITSKKLLTKLNIEPIKGMIFAEDIMNSITPLNKIKALIKSKLPTKTLIKLYAQNNENDNAVILFTSGSEKAPKAVQLSHKNISHNIDSFKAINDFTPKDIFLLNLPIFHVYGLTVTFWTPLLLSCTIVTHINPIDHKDNCRTIRENKVTVLAGTPSFLYGYLRKSKEGDFKSVRVAFCGADKLTANIQEGFLEKHNLQIQEGYGTTETSPVISTNLPYQHKIGSIGKPLPNVKIKILDIDSDEKCPPMKIGKIYVKGDLVMKGYYDDLEETTMKIHNKWYDTGDMGYIDEEGFLFHEGRLKRFVKIGGEMISLVKVENELIKLLPEESLCCVVDVPNITKGADIIAVVTNPDLNFKILKKKLSKSLPNIAIPKKFYVLDNLPIISSGKVDFKSVEKIIRNIIRNKNKNS